MVMATKPKNHRARARRKHPAILASSIAALVAFCVVPSGARAQTLYVDQEIGGTVGTYNATTGAVINANFITGLSRPQDLLFSGNKLYVANLLSNTVGVYNATTGVAVTPNPITGLSNPDGLGISGNNLYVANWNGGTAGAGTVGEYNATTGAPINSSLITGLNGPWGIVTSATSSSWQTPEAAFQTGRPWANITPPRERR